MDKGLEERFTSKLCYCFLLTYKHDIEIKMRMTRCVLICNSKDIKSSKQFFHEYVTDIFAMPIFLFLDDNKIV